MIATGSGGASCWGVVKSPSAFERRLHQGPDERVFHLVVGARADVVLVAGMCENAAARCVCLTEVFFSVPFGFEKNLIADRDVSV